MNWKTVVPLVVALVLGTVAAVVGRGMMARGRQAATAPAGRAQVVVANVDLTPGAVVREADVGVREMAAGGLPAELIFADARDVVGRVVTTQVIDRGPYVSGRTWDLSGALCLKLDHCYTGPIEWRFPGG